MESSGFGQTLADASARRPCVVTDSKLELHTVYWVEIYPADSVVPLSHNWAQADCLCCG